MALILENLGSEDLFILHWPSTWIDDWLLKLGPTKSDVSKGVGFSVSGPRKKLCSPFSLYVAFTADKYLIHPSAHFYADIFSK